MLRRDITPEQFVMAVRAAQMEQGVLADMAARRPTVRALFETEEEDAGSPSCDTSIGAVSQEASPAPTPPAGSEEQPASYWKGLADEWERDNLRLERENAAICRDYAALRAEFTKLNEVAKANGALARSLRAEVERLKGDREALLHSVIDTVNGWTEGADTVSLPTLTAHRLAAVAVKQALAIDAARTAGEGRDG